MGNVIGFHVVGCTYGFWLPNDHRGSGSDCVRSEALRQFGPATRVTHRRSVAHAPFDPEIRKLAQRSLSYPHVLFNRAQIDSVSRGFANEIKQFCAAPMYAMAQLSNHFHFVCGQCRYDIRRFEGRLKGAATRQLLNDGLHPLMNFRDKSGKIPSPWSVKPWVVYLFTSDDMIRSIEYVRKNLRRARLAQIHPFVVPYRASSLARSPIISRVET